MPQTTKAILFVICAMFGFSVMDALVKELTLHKVEPLQIAWARYTGQALLVLVLIALRTRSVLRTSYPSLQLARSVFLLLGTGCYFVVLTKINLLQAKAIIDINASLITLGAVLFLGEKISRSRAIAIALSLIALLIIIRPGSDDFSNYSLLALVGAFCYSGYGLLTRYVGPREDPWTTMFYTALFGAAILSAVMPAYWHPVSREDAFLMVAVAVAGTMGHFFLIRGFSIAEANMLTPFTYSGLFFVLIWSLLFFEEIPTRHTLFGALAIALAGIYVWYGETKRR